MIRIETKQNLLGLESGPIYLDDYVECNDFVLPNYIFDRKVALKEEPLWTTTTSDTQKDPSQ